MDTAYLHIVTNHIPIIGVPLALVLLLLGVWRKSDELKTAGFLILVFLGLATLGVYLSGQGGEDFVEDLAGISDQAIEDHQDFAGFALASVALTAVFSLYALIRYKGFSFITRPETEEKSPLAGDEEKLTANEIPAGGAAYPTWMTAAVLLLALASGGILGYTGKLGGKIRHTEFYGGAPDKEAEKDGKTRRGRNEPKPEKIPPIADDETNTRTTEQPPEEREEKDPEGGGKGRRRNRGRN